MISAVSQNGSIRSGLAAVLLQFGNGIPGFLIKFQIPEIVPLILFRYFSQYPTGIACCQRPVGNIFRHYASPTDYHIISDGDAGKNHCIAANPDVVSNGNGNSVFIELRDTGWRGWPAV